jgi:hypothetical protein
MILSFLGINEPVILFGGGIVVLAVNRIAQRFRIDLPTIALTLLMAVTRFRFPLIRRRRFEVAQSSACHRKADGDEQEK